jgi:hypothetical protein
MTLLIVLGYGAGGTPTIAFIVKDSSVLASAEHPYVAIPIMRSAR